MRKHGSALLVELMIVILFFTIAATVVLEVFAAADRITCASASETAALRQGQNLAERLYAAGDGEQLLMTEGFTKNDDCWTKYEDSLHINVTEMTQQTEVGLLKTYSIAILDGESNLLTLPVTRFVAGEVSP